MKTTIFLIRRHSKEECLVKVRESKMVTEIMEDKHISEEKLRHWDREREAIYISPEICV